MDDKTGVGSSVSHPVTKGDPQNCLFV